MLKCRLQQRLLQLHTLQGQTLHFTAYRCPTYLCAFGHCAHNAILRTLLDTDAMVAALHSHKQQHKQQHTRRLDCLCTLMCLVEDTTGMYPPLHVFVTSLCNLGYKSTLTTGSGPQTVDGNMQHHMASLHRLVSS